MLTKRRLFVALIFLMTLFIGLFLWSNSSSQNGRKIIFNESISNDLQGIQPQISSSSKEKKVVERNHFSKEKRLKSNNREAGERKVADDSVLDPSQEFVRENFEGKANELKMIAKEMFSRYRTLEKEKGKIEKEENGQKVIVTVPIDEKRYTTLIYLPNDYLHEIAESHKDYGQHGITAYYRMDGTPYKVFQWQNNKLNGLVVEYNLKGRLIRYFETQDMCISGIYAQWNSDGSPTENCKVYIEPFYIQGP